MILLIDVGNTRFKWATLERGELSSQQAIPHRNRDVADLVGVALKDLNRIGRILVSNVAGPDFARELAAALERAQTPKPEIVRSTAAACGIKNGYTNPEQLGVDRWLAMIGARSISSHAACVVSAGTALTVDALTASGEHLGGVIVPGPEMMESSLFRGTGDLAARSAEGTDGVSLFATDTRAAIRQGTQHSLGALIERATRVLSAHVGVEVELFVTGGAGERVLPVAHRPARFVPDLVLRGLAALAEATGEP
jgi:type III pantothenate kinase